MFRYSAVALGAAVLIAMGTVAAAQHEPLKGSTVTMTACIEKAERGDDKLVLTNIADVPTQPAPHGRLVYWFSDDDDVKMLKKHIGHQVRLTGKVEDTKQEEIDVKLGKGQTGILVKIEGPGNNVKTSPDKAGVSAAGQTEKKREIPTTLVKLDMQKLEMVTDRCMLNTR